jgi:hypothetical protein
MNPFVTKPPDRCVEDRWPVLNANPMVFVGSVAVRADQGAAAFDLPDFDLYAFGGRNPTPPETLPAHLRDKPSFRIVFTVLEHRLADSMWKEHHLSQHDDRIAWSKKTDFDDCLSVDMMAKSAFRFLRRKPRWKISDASWPAINQQPMVFLAQWPLPENEVTRSALTFGSMVFLFAEQEKNATLNVKMWMQDMRSQTAEEHYNAEELMALLEANRNDEEVVARCIRDGDVYVHEFILDNPSVSAKALELLAKHGQGKKLREAAARKLRQRK